VSLPPRIRGRVGQASEPKEWAGKFAFEISMWTFDGETQIGDPFGPFGPYDTEAQAKDAMRRACQLASESIEQAMTGKVSGKYLDLKNGGVLRQWEEN
jgi:hypothetical protein